MAEFKYFDTAGNVMKAEMAGMRARQNLDDRNALKTAGQMAAKGDFTGAQNSAFSNGLINVAKGFNSFEGQRRRQAQASAASEAAKDAKELNMVLHYAQAAQSPEQYEAGKQALIQSGIDPKAVELMGGFENRDFFVQRSLPVMDQLKMQLDKEKLASKNSPEFNKTPIYGTDALGNTVILQTNTAGRATQTALPEGIRLSKPTKVDTATGTQIVDQYSGRTIKDIKTNVEEAEKLKVRGREREKLRFTLPKLRVSNKLLSQQHGFLIGKGGEIDRALSILGVDSAGFGALVSSLPTSKAKELKQRILTIKANIGFDKLQSMREASPTGGALGQVAIQELEALQAVIGSLEQSQDPQVLRDNLIRIKEEIRANGKIRGELFRDLEKEVRGAGAPRRSQRSQGNPNSQALNKAREAISRGAPRAAVIQRLKDNGIDPGGL